MNVSRQARLGRGLLAAAFAVLIAAVSHSLAGGVIAGPLPLLLGFVVAMLVCVPLAARRLSWPALLAGVATSQLAFHLLFELFGPVAGPTPGGAAASAFAASGHHHGGAPAPLLDTAAITVADHPMHDGAGMWLAHIAAGLLTIAMLRGGEAAAWRLIELAVGWALARMPRSVAVPILPRLRATAAVAAPVRRSSALLRTALRYRGPPVAAA